MSSVVGGAALSDALRGFSKDGVSSSAIRYVLSDLALIILLILLVLVSLMSCGTLIKWLMFIIPVGAYIAWEIKKSRGPQILHPNFSNQLNNQQSMRPMRPMYPMQPPMMTPMMPPMMQQPSMMTSMTQGQPSMMTSMTQGQPPMMPLPRANTV